MADNSEFILRWEIDATAALASKKAESDVFNKGGFKWTIAIDDNADPSKGRADLILRCDNDNNGPWKCEVEAGHYFLRTDGTYFDYFKEERYCFDENNHIWKRERFDYWDMFYYSNYLVNGKSIHEFRINIISSEGGQPIVYSTFFDVSNRRSDVILKIGEHKLHVSKELLAVYSPVFETMFFGDFSENGKEEVEIKDAVYEEFVDLLHLIYTKRVKITDRTISHILKLSDQYQVESILELSKEYLAETKGIDTMKKLLLADRYRLDSLRDQCLQTFTTTTRVMEIIKSSEYEEFSGMMKAAICDRMRKF